MTNNKQQTEMNAVEYLDKVNQFAKENNTGKPRQQTAVEWLRLELLKRDMDVSVRELFEQAKEMEKQQIRNAYNDGHTDGAIDRPGLTSGTTYYNETYGGGEQ
jgi:hypothetical protein